MTGWNSHPMKSGQYFGRTSAVVLQFNEVLDPQYVDRAADSAVGIRYHHPVAAWIRA
jgi:hypothetical protein